MASSVILRKLFPCAARVVSSRRIRPPTAVSSLIPNAWLAPATAFPCHRDFSASAATDNKLVEAIESEIQTYLHSHYQKEHFPFKIEEDDVENVIRLEREYEGDTIKVKVFKQIFYEMTEYVVDVEVVKKKGATLKFYCTASDNEITLRKVSMYKEKEKIIEPACDYPYIFDESLQKTFLKYLEVRGVNTSMINCLSNSIDVDAHNLARIAWLNELKTAVEA